MSSSPGPSSHSPLSPPYGRSLSPPKHNRDRSLSRPSSRGSIRSGRAPSPSQQSLEANPVALRNQMSTLKHSIRQQQAQLHNLENIVLRGPRPLPPDTSDIMLSSPPPPSSFSPVPTATKVKRRSSYDVLQGIAGPESSLPLPRREAEENGIQEGVPMSFGVGPSSPTSFKRASSPMRTLSRIPVAAVGNARALADEGQRLSSSTASKTSPIAENDLFASTSSLQPPSPNRRASFTPAGTTKVLADLQAGVVNARTALENTKSQLRLSQRTVAQLTRQTEDLKEARERLRLENEGLNNVVARKERLLQEVLERARKAEAEATQLKSQLKSETSTSKKTIREMESALSESTALSQKSEREYITLRDSIKGLVSGFKSDTEKLREEMRKREEKLRGDAESVGKKYQQLLEEVKNAEKTRAELNELRDEDKKKEKEVEAMWTEEVNRMKAEVEKHSKGSEEAGNTAKELASELARLRRLMQTYRRSSTQYISTELEPEDIPP
ncbi:hypothetical protein CCMSSC00406_0006808 [Pleurotus cornucopiae]|uniref:Uncharacterized protein n=1 Tax=Pleurotus cornucopiae TaxID=5321 RepID=A0ACB7J1I3_PLECO|nr:hypothetical protein CCMSSC00406_0006808 [Pleurotus cornucopiae]